MSKHTPGPWKVEVSENHTNVEAPMFTVAADVTNADALLISAAPEMLEALKRAAARLHKIKASGLSDESFTLPILEAAIAKAEGRNE